MRSTLPNTDQPCIPLSECHYNLRRRSSERVGLGLARPPTLPVAVLSPRQALFALHSFAFTFFPVFCRYFIVVIFPSAFKHTFFFSLSSLVILLSLIREPLADSGLRFVTSTLGLQLSRLCGSSFSIYCLPVFSRRGILL